MSLVYRSPHTDLLGWLGAFGSRIQQRNVSPNGHSPRGDAGRIQAHTYVCTRTRARAYLCVSVQSDMLFVFEPGSVANGF